LREASNMDKITILLLAVCAFACYSEAMDVKKVVCPPLCKMLCPFGFEKDANGCEICKCKKPDILCRMFCPLGFEKDANGKSLCKCIKGCLYNGKAYKTGEEFGCMLGKRRSCRCKESGRVSCAIPDCVRPPSPMCKFVKSEQCCPEYKCPIGDACNKVCTREHMPLCGSDGKTYRNKCTFSVANCKAKYKLTMKHPGQCTKGCLHNGIVQDRR